MPTAIGRSTFTSDGGGNTVAAPLSSFTSDLPAHRWTRVAVNLTRITSASLLQFLPGQLSSVIFSQSTADSKPHTLYVDEIRINNDASSNPRPVSASSLKAKGYERHVDLQWQAAADDTTAEYVIYRSDQGGAFRQSARSSMACPALPITSERRTEKLLTG